MLYTHLSYAGLQGGGGLELIPTSTERDARCYLDTSPVCYMANIQTDWLFHPCGQLESLDRRRKPRAPRGNLHREHSNQGHSWIWTEDPPAVMTVWTTEPQPNTWTVCQRCNYFLNPLATFSHIQTWYNKNLSLVFAVIVVSQNVANPEKGK